MKHVSDMVGFGAVSSIALDVAFTNVAADNARNPLADHVRAANDRYGRAPFYDLLVFVGDRESISDALICKARYFE